jgi:hypothetical protein
LELVRETVFKRFMVESRNKNAPEVKAWVRRMAAVSGLVPESAAAEAKLGWYGVELAS